MKQLNILLAAVLIAISSEQPKKIHGTGEHIWVLKQDSAVEINFYDISNCIPNPNTYCTYWTTTDFGVHSMPDSTFQALLTAGVFTGHDYNRRYVP